MDQESVTLPQALSPEFLVYQNKQLIRLVRELRKRIPAESTTCDDSPDLHSQLAMRVQELESNRVALYSRLDRLKRKADNPHIADLSHQKSNVSESSVSLNKDEIRKLEEPQVPSEYLASLNKEISRLATALALSASGMQPAVKQATTEIELFNLNSDRNLWAQKANNTEKGLSEIDRRVKEVVERLDSSVAQTEETFLKEISRLAEELANRHHELRKSKEVISDLEQKLKHTTVASSRSVSTEGEFQAKLADQLRMKEEQCTRLLAQHVQLQHRVTALEQEAVVLQSRDHAVDDLIKKTEDELKGWEAREARQADLLRAVEQECGKEKELREALELELIQARKDLKALEELNTSYRSTIEVMRTEFQQSLQNLSEDKRLKLSQTGKSGAQAGSLLQIELDEIKEKIKCPLCLSRSKTVALTPCMHCFCRECVDEKMLNARNRKCPLCMQRFADSDVRKLM